MEFKKYISTAQLAFEELVHGGVTRNNSPEVTEVIVCAIVSRVFFLTIVIVQNVVQ